MASSRIPITTFGLGGVASCGLLLFMAGDTRVLSPNTSVLSHQFNWGTRGKEHELVADRVEQDNTSDRILAHYKSCTGLTEKLIKAELLGPSDTWLTAKQALKYNLCDHVKTFRM
jgi:ATP-dependent Clp protease protease subunit